MSMCKTYRRTFVRYHGQFHRQSNSIGLPNFGWSKRNGVWVAKKEQGLGGIGPRFNLTLKIFQSSNCYLKH
jgi:hypothetical protein